MFPCKMRIARPVSDLERSYKMYEQGLGLEKIGEFSDHQSFSGVMLGHPSLSWHLEFTLCDSHPLRPQATAEDLLVLYVPDLNAWENGCRNMQAAGFEVVESFNPYWEVAGKTFVDSDGYRVVLQNRAWG